MNVEPAEHMEPAEHVELEPVKALDDDDDVLTLKLTTWSMNLTPIP